MSSAPERPKLIERLISILVGVATVERLDCITISVYEITGVTVSAHRLSRPCAAIVLKVERCYCSDDCRMVPAGSGQQLERVISILVGVTMVDFLSGAGSRKGYMLLYNTRGDAS